MPEFASRKYITRVDYLADFVGADIPRNLVKIAIAAQDNGAKPLVVKDQQIPIPLEQDSDGAVYLVIKADNAGLAKSADVADLKGSQNKDFTTLETDVESILSRLDINLSEIKAVGTETPRTLSNIYDALTGGGNFSFDTRNYLLIDYTSDKVEVIDRLTVHDEFIASGQEEAFKSYTVGTDLVTRVDGLLRTDELGGDGVITGDGTVANFS